ncbi:MAG: DUF3667 domain-containing protein [Chitinophagaceae bacterium]|nr:MAG: DUF3667 domain-containing protein [Chitinophagaceae bacterium]
MRYRSVSPLSEINSWRLKRVACAWEASEVTMRMKPRTIRCRYMKKICAKIPYKMLSAHFRDIEFPVGSTPKFLPSPQPKQHALHASPTVCANCAQSLAPDFSYCPRCSQKTELHRLSLHEIGHEALHYFTHADRSLFGLLRGLATRTGAVAREYVEGKRKAWFPPLNFFLLVGTVYVLILSALAPSSNFNVFAEHPELSAMTAAKRAQMITIYTRQHDAIQFMNHYSNVVSMLAAPLIAAIFWLFYLRGRYNYTEHLVAGLYMGGFTNLCFALIGAPLARLMGFQQGNSSYLAVVGLLLCGQVAYNSIFYRRFMGRSGGRAMLKALLVSLAATGFWFLISTTAVTIYIAAGVLKSKGH